MSELLNYFCHSLEGFKTAHKYCLRENSYAQRTSIKHLQRTRKSAVEKRNDTIL